MKIQIGQKAPDFKLVDSERKERKLSEFEGSNVVLLFVPAAFSGACTAEMCDMRDNLSFYKKLDAQILVISTDTFFTLKKWRDELKVDFVMLSDYNKEICGLYGAQYDEWITGMKGPAKRASFVIDREGIVRYVEVLESAGDPINFDGVKAALSAVGSPA